MDIDLELLEDSHRFDNLLRERNNASAYLAITSQMGPSPQLLAFVAPEGYIVTDNGVALESLSIMDQHKFITSYLDVDALDTMALESLADRIRKISKMMIKGGAIGIIASWFVPGGMIINTLSWAAIAGGAIARKASGVATATYATSAFATCEKLFESCLAYDIQVAQSIPSGFTLKEWEAFSTKLMTDLKPKAAAAIAKRASKKDLKKVPFDRSGWTEANFIQAVKWLKTHVEKIEALQKAYGGKLDKIAGFLTNSSNNKEDSVKVAALISSTVGLTTQMFSNSVACLTDVKSVLEDVARRFEESKKD